MEEKKIIGYKLVKPEYEEAVKKITGYTKWDYVNLKDCEGKHYIPVKFETACYDALKEAGVLDLWFEPVYEEEKYKTDDIVIAKCINTEYIGKYIDNEHLKDWVLLSFLKNTNKRGNGGSFSKTLRKATKEEIEEYNRPKLPVINGYDGRIEGDYVIYGCARFDKDWFRNLYVHLSHHLYKNTRKTMSIKLDSGVEITMEQIKQIVGYLNKN